MYSVGTQEMCQQNARQSRKVAKLLTGDSSEVAHVLNLSGDHTGDGPDEDAHGETETVLA